MNIIKFLLFPQAPRYILGVTVVLVGVACGGGTSSSAVSPDSPEGVIRAFMEAVNDTNLVRMGELWGTSAGPAVGRMDRDELQRRLVIMQRYLANRSYQVEPAQPGQIIPGGSGEQYYNVRFVRADGCATTVPMTVVRRGDGWLISNLDLAEAGTPGRPC